MATRTASKTTEAEAESTEGFSLESLGLSVETVDKVPAMSRRGRGFDAETIKLAHHIQESEKAGKVCAIPGVTAENRNKVNSKIDAAVRYIQKQQPESETPFKIRRNLDPETNTLYFGEDGLVTRLMPKG